MREDVVRFLEDKTDAWEIYSEVSKTLTVKVERGRVKMVELSKDTGYAVRVIVSGRVGFATSSRLSIEMCEFAVKVARVSEERLSDFPVGRRRRVEGVYDKRVEEADAGLLKDFAEGMVNSATEVGNVNPANGYVEASVDEVRVVNSSGTDLTEKVTMCEAYLECVADESNAFEFDQSRSVKINFERVGRIAAELALKSRGGVKLESGKYDVVLSPIAVHELLSNALYPAFLADNVLKGRSPLTDLGREYVGEVTIVDDPLVPCGLMSYEFDDEGVEPRRKVVFEKGVLMEYLNDLKSAEEMGSEPTGNGIRGEDLHPSPTPSNVIIEYGSREGDVTEGSLYVHSLIGAHTSNPVSGDFSLECMNAFLIRGGDWIPVRSVMLYGNVYELLRRVVCFGRDVRQVDNTIAPSIRFGDVRVIAD